jgi:microsomal dipeptidase-like Zn-dependent dipeptidase
MSRWKSVAATAALIRRGYGDDNIRAVRGEFWVS